VGRSAEQLYARALERALTATQRELDFLNSTREELLVAPADRIVELGKGAGRLASRLERRGKVLSGRATALAEALRAEENTFTSISGRMQSVRRDELASLVATTRSSGLALVKERKRYRETLRIGHLALRHMLERLTGPGESGRPKRRGGSAQVRRVGVINVRA
jgi:hypothetical protein